MVYVPFCSDCLHQKPLSNCRKCVLKDMSLQNFLHQNQLCQSFPPLLMHKCYLWVAPWDITITNTPTSRLSKEAVFRFCWEISKSKTVPVDYANTVYKFAFTTITKGSDKPATQLLSYTLLQYSCDSNCRSVANCSNGLKVLSCNGSIRRHGEIYGRQHGSN